MKVVVFDEVLDLVVHKQWTCVESRNYSSFPTLCFYHVKAILNTIILGQFLYLLKRGGEEREREENGHEEKEEAWYGSLFNSFRVFRDPFLPFHSQNERRKFSLFLFSNGTFKCPLAALPLAAVSLIPSLSLWSLSATFSSPFTFTFLKERVVRGEERTGTKDRTKEVVGRSDLDPGFKMPFSLFSFPLFLLLPSLSSFSTPFAQLTISAFFSPFSIPSSIFVAN